MLAKCAFCCLADLFTECTDQLWDPQVRHNTLPVVCPSITQPSCGKPDVDIALCVLLNPLLPGTAYECAQCHHEWRSVVFSLPVYLYKRCCTIVLNYEQAEQHYLLSPIAMSAFLRVCSWRSSPGASTCMVVPVWLFLHADVIPGMKLQGQSCKVRERGKCRPLKAVRVASWCWFAFTRGSLFGPAPAVCP